MPSCVGYRKWKDRGIGKNEAFLSVGRFETEATCRQPERRNGAAGFSETTFIVYQKHKGSGVDQTRCVP